MPENPVENPIMGVAEQGSEIRLTKDYSRQVAERNRAAEDGKYKGTIGSALITAERQFQDAISRRDQETDDGRRRDLEGEVSRISSILTVLEHDTGLFIKIKQRESEVGVNDGMSRENRERFSRMIKEQAWKGMSIDDAIAALDAAWEHELENPDNGPDYLAEKKNDINEAKILLQTLRGNSVTVR